MESTEWRKSEEDIKKWGKRKSVDNASTCSLVFWRRQLSRQWLDHVDSPASAPQTPDASTLSRRQKGGHKPTGRKNSKKWKETERRGRERQRNLGSKVAGPLLETTKRVLVSPFPFFRFCVRPLSSEWPLWSEVRTILPLKLWHCAQVAAGGKRAASRLVLSRLRFPQLSLQEAYSARITSPPVLTFWHPVCCLLVRWKSGLNHW